MYMCAYVYVRLCICAPQAERMEAAKGCICAPMYVYMCTSGRAHGSSLCRRHTWHRVQGRTLAHPHMVATLADLVEVAAQEGGGAAGGAGGVLGEAS